MSGDGGDGNYKVQQVPTMSEYQKWFVDNALGGLANMLSGSVWGQPYGGPFASSFDPRQLQFTNRKPEYEYLPNNTGGGGGDDVEEGDNMEDDTGGGEEDPDDAESAKPFKPIPKITGAGQSMGGPAPQSGGPNIPPQVFAQMMMGGGQPQMGMQGGGQPMGGPPGMPPQGMPQQGMPQGGGGPWTPGMPMPQNPFTQTYTNPYVDPYRQAMTGNFPGGG